MAKKSEYHFAHYMVAGYPLLWVETYEEHRAIMTLCQEMDKQQEDFTVYTWDCISGIHKKELKNNEVTSVALKTEIPMVKPLDALTWFEQEKGDNQILILKDIHPFLKKEPAINRKLRNLIPKFKSMLKAMVIVSPTVSIPPEIEKEITVVHYSLPDRDRLKVVLQNIVNAASEWTGEEMSYPDKEEEIIDACRGMTEFEAENALSVSLVEHGEFIPEVIRREKAGVVEKTGLLEVIDCEYTLADVGGLENLKKWLNNRKDCFSEKARKFGLKPPKGLLLVGVPGCGKSLSAKSVAQSWERPLLRMDVGKLFGSYVGQSEENLRRSLKIAEAVAPCVLWIDELEKSFAGIQGGGDTSGVAKRVFGSFLTWLSDKTADVFIVATANDVSSIPPEMLRGGRFDCMFWVDLPDNDQRQEILGIHLRRKGRKAKDFKDEMPKLAGLSEDFSGAELEVWLEEALVKAFSENHDLCFDDFNATAQEITPVARLMKKEIESSRQWSKERGCKRASLKKEKPISKIGTGRKLSSLSGGPIAAS